MNNPYIKFNILFFIFFICYSFIISASEFSPSRDSTNMKRITWNEHRNKPSKEQQVGVAVYYEAMKIDYNRNKKQILEIVFKEPVSIYQATKPESWGFVQFPRIFRVPFENKIAATWNLAEDDIDAQNKIGWRYSKDDGKSWFFRWKERPYDLGLILPNGDRLKLTSRKFKIDSTLLISVPVERIGLNRTSAQYNFYDRKKMPDSLNGFYTSRYIERENKIITKHTPILNDFETYGYSIKGIFPVQAWGNLRRMSNGTLFTCQYPVFLITNRIIKLSEVGFYDSTDDGQTWRMISHIPYQADPKFEPDNSEREIYGFTEPTFEILDNGLIICILRSSIGIQSGPMYMSISRDFGKTWDTPKVIASNGVSPQILKLDNGVIVLSSGRPGVQVRFLTDSDNIVWTDAFEMIRYKDLKGQVTCGYTGMISTGPDRFLIIYSDFRSRDSNNNLRKAIVVREVIVKKKK